MRGIASTANAVTPASASARVVSTLVKGPRKPISTEPRSSRPISSMLGARTTATTSAPQASAAEPTVTPASVYARSGMCDSSPAPDSTTASTPRAASFFATSGTSATRFSPRADWLGTPSFIGGRREDNEARGRSSAGRSQLHASEPLGLAADPRQEAVSVGAVVGPGEHQQLGPDERGDVGVLAAQGVGEAREGDDLVGALALRQPLPV